MPVNRKTPVSVVAAFFMLVAIPIGYALGRYFGDAVLGAMIAAPLGLWLGAAIDN